MLTFPNVTPAVFALVLDQLRTEATVLAQKTNAYAIQGNGIDATVEYGPLASVVDVTIHKKPWYVPESVIASKIRDAITLAQQAVAHQDGMA